METTRPSESKRQRMGPENYQSIAEAFCSARPGSIFVLSTEENADGIAISFSANDKEFLAECDHTGVRFAGSTKVCEKLGPSLLQLSKTPFEVLLNDAFAAIAGGGTAATPAAAEASSTDDSDSEDDDSDDDDSDDAGFEFDEPDAPEQGGATGGAPKGEDFFTGSGSGGATKRLIADLKGIMAAGDEFGFRASPDGDNLYKWKCELFGFEAGSTLARDLKAYAEQYGQKETIELSMQFPKDYPMAPPFLRVIRPRFAFMTGHITLGGSVCMQMLTNSGWLPTNSIEAVLVQVRSEIVSDPNVHLDYGRENQEYSEGDARAAFQRMCAKYGW